METNINYTLVGAFVLILSAAIVFGIIWLSSGFSNVSYNTYLINSPESVTGLNLDAPVEYNGVNVGSVSNIQLDNQNPHIVKILVKIKNGTPITEGTRAIIQTKGLTGVSNISLQDQTGDLTPLTAEKGQPYPIIKSAPSLFVRLDAAVTKLTSSLSSLSTSMQALLNDNNLRYIQNTLKQLDIITKIFAKNSNQLNAIFSNTATASGQFSSTMQSFSNQTLPLTDQVLTNVYSTSTLIRENPAVILRGTEPAPLGPGEH